MRVNRGDVVLVDYPYSDRTGSKIRPCVVVQNDRNNQRLDDTIVVTISRRTQTAEPTQLLILAASKEGKQAGLLSDSSVRCENILSVDLSFVKRKIGTLTSDLMDKVDACLKESLDLV
jgi:mRNA interferase MazF